MHFWDLCVSDSTALFCDTYYEFWRAIIISMPTQKVLIQNLITVIKQCNKEFLMKKKKKPSEHEKILVNTLFLHYMVPFSLHLDVYLYIHCSWCTQLAATICTSNTTMYQIYGHCLVLRSKKFFNTIILVDEEMTVIFCKNCFGQQTKTTTW